MTKISPEITPGEIRKTSEFWELRSAVGPSVLDANRAAGRVIFGGRQREPMIRLIMGDFLWLHLIFLLLNLLGGILAPLAVLGQVNPNLTWTCIFSLYLPSLQFNTLNLSKLKMLFAEWDLLYLCASSAVFMLGRAIYSIQYGVANAVFHLIWVLIYFFMFVSFDASPMQWRKQGTQRSKSNIIVIAVFNTVLILLLMAEVLPGARDMPTFYVGNEEFSTFRLIVDPGVVVNIYLLLLVYSLNRLALQPNELLFLSAPMKLERFTSLSEWDSYHDSLKNNLQKSVSREVWGERGSMIASSAPKQRRSFFETLKGVPTETGFMTVPRYTLLVPKSDALILYREDMLGWKFFATPVGSAVQRFFQKTKTIWSLVWYAWMVLVILIIGDLVPKAVSWLALPACLPILMSLMNKNKTLMYALLHTFEVRWLSVLLSIATVGFVIATADIRALNAPTIWLNFLNLFYMDASLGGVRKHSNREDGQADQMLTARKRRLHILNLVGNILWISANLTGFYLKWYAGDFVIYKFQIGAIVSTSLAKLLETPLLTILPFLLKNLYRKMRGHNLTTLRCSVSEIPLTTASDLDSVYVERRQSVRLSLSRHLLESKK